MAAIIRSITRTAINNPQKSIEFEPYLLEEFLTKVVEAYPGLLRLGRKGKSVAWLASHKNFE